MLHRSTRLLWLLLALLLACGESLAVPNARGASPGGSIGYELSPDGGGTSIWLFPRLLPSQRTLLCRTEGASGFRLYFLPGENWLLVEDGGAAEGVDIRVFRKTADLSYREIAGSAIALKAERMALQQAGFTSLYAPLDHRFAVVLRAPSDPRAVPIAFSGYGRLGGRVVNIKNWHGLYDLERGELRSTSVVRYLPAYGGRGRIGYSGAPASAVRRTGASSRKRGSQGHLTKRP